ncbi:hypothetical protein J4211_03670 [Candidatus Woesearchaeota archaeon]|nr:hypothetical protein [Candidatus Woesearchaeota archaeon]
MSGLVERLHDKMQKIHGGLKVHPLPKLKAVINETFAICDKAITYRALEPYASFAISVHEMLDEASAELNECPTRLIKVRYKISPSPQTFQFLIPQDPATQNYLSQEICRAKNYVDRFVALYDEASQQVRLQLWPSEGLVETRVNAPLPWCGRFFVVLSKGVHLLDFEFHQRGEQVEARGEILNTQPLPYRDALNNVHQGAFIEVTKADNYPLEETIKPVLIGKYSTFLTATR